MGGKKVSIFGPTHKLAMDLAEYALIARLHGDTGVADELILRAFEYEREAAETLVDCFDDELMRSVLYRSAASLAMQCGEFSEAERLIDAGLQGNPPGDIAQELRDLRKQVTSQRRTQLQKQHSA